MPYSPRVLAAAIAALFLFSAVPPAEAAKKKGSRPAAAQTRQAAKPKARTGTRATPPARGSSARRAAPRPVAPARAVPKQVQLERLYDEYWDASMRLNPLLARVAGRYSVAMKPRRAR